MSSGSDNDNDSCVGNPTDKLNKIKSTYDSGIATGSNNDIDIETMGMVNTLMMGTNNDNNDT